MANEKEKEALKRQFRSQDANGDGCLDRSEFVKLLEGKNKMTRGQMDLLFDQVDQNKDGKIDFNEFVDYVFSPGSDQPQTAKSRTSECRRQRLSAQTAIDTTSDDPDLWEDVYESFSGYQGHDNAFQQNDLNKLCLDCKLYDKNFQKTHLGMVFAKFSNKQSIIGFGQFQDCLRDIARRKGVPTSFVQMCVADRRGRRDEHATNPDFVKFHDDRSTYTGTHTENENHKAMGARHKREEERHNRLAQEWDGKEPLNREEWSQVETLFPRFCTDRGSEGGMTGRDFNQLCQDCNILGAKFATNDVDIIFAKVKKGRLHIDFATFLEAMSHVSAQTGKSPSKLKELILKTGGPKFNATKADDVRLHNDPSTYTGIHYGKKTGHM